MIKHFKLVLLLLASLLLTGCLGGSIAQQIVSSIATRVADRAVANALDVQDGPSNRKPQNGAAQNSDADEIRVMLATAGFRKIDQNTPPPVEMPAAEEPAPVFQTNSLVRVQLYNLLIGDEKNAVFEKARRLGALNLPQQREWARWNVATGITEKDKKPITFLIPPEFGKLPSGTLAMVELAGPGDLNIARYK